MKIIKRSCLLVVYSVIVMMVAYSLPAFVWAAPVITAMQPPDGSIVPATTPIMASFSEAMDPSAITVGSFTVSKYVGFKAIATGNGYTVALKNDGTIVAWGDNYYGQTTVPSGLSGVTAIAAGGGHTVALKNNGTVVAWGYNVYGQSNVPSGLSGVIAIAAGNSHT
ncbi:MAG TPA: Ig-like domain-containing protein, partial [Thermodesulfovibrionales bacterium]|nr:Ig-like domain-containing protein [Thermodesulfovibrionales bacterium]